jgi:hypothetical protein
MRAVGERILLTIWVGGLWAVGYLAVPVLFHTLDDRALAGQLAASMFHIIGFIGLFCGTLLLISAAVAAGAAWLRSWRVWALVVMLALVAAGVFVLQPMMADLKAMNYAADAVLAARFKMLHGVSSAMYLITSLLGLALVAANPKATGPSV